MPATGGTRAAITKKTIVPISIGMLITMGGMLVGFTTAFVVTGRQGDANASDIAQIKADVIREKDERTGLLERLDRRLSRIEGKLGIHGD